MRLSRHPSTLRVVAGAALASVVLVACGAGGSGTGSLPVTGPAAESGDVGTAGGQPRGASNEAAAALAQVFASATPLDGVSFDGATLAGTDAVVWFWAPWCTICRAEAPEVAEIAERYAEQVRVIGVPGRGELDAMHRFVDDTGTGAIIHLADLDGDIWSAFGVYGQPAFAFIDDTGDIEVFVGGMGGDALAERIDDLLAT